MLRDRVFRGVLGRIAFVTGILLALLVFRAPYFDLTLRLWFVALGAILVWAISARSLTGLRTAGSQRRAWQGRWWQRPAAAERVRGLEELEHAVQFSQTTAFDLHFRLRPHLVRVATHRLGVRGIQLEAQPERARAVLGEEVWDLVRPERPAPVQRNAHGIDLGTLRRVVERLDAI